MSAVNKLVTELARKQRECRKAKLHAVVSTSCQTSGYICVTECSGLLPPHALVDRLVQLITQHPAEDLCT